MAIHILSPEVANRIAAGEVVERPASVVKELIENALDAGAREILVEIQEGGRRLIRVVDDGSGISSADAEVAFARHATSKLSRLEDLEGITTLGFRGEALASIAAVSRLTLSTRSPGEELGTLLELEAGRLIRRDAIGRPAGVSLTVEHLFYNVPARLKFLRTPVTETGHVSELVTLYALAYPVVRFRLVSDSRLLFRSDGTGELRDVLLAAFGADVVRELIPLDPPCNDDEGLDRLRLVGYIGTPSLHRSHRQQMIFFVNGRWIKDRSLSYAVVQAYHTFLASGRFPVSVVMIEMSASEVDVNVHPTKAEVRFREPGRVFGLVQRRVRSTLLRQAPIPEAHHWSTSGTSPSPELPAGWDWERRQKLIEAGQGQLALHAEPSPSAGSPLAVSSDADGRARLPILRVLGQVRQTYIIAEGPDGLYLIDQHAAHERVLYDQMRSGSGGGQPAAQQLLEPHVLSVDPRYAGVLVERLPELARVGFEMEPFGAQAFLIRAVPAAFGIERNPAEALMNVLEDLERGEAPLAREEDAAIQAAVCKGAAVKAGQTLSQSEMIELVRQLEITDSPRTCPHGRPTMIHLSADHLARQFARPSSGE